MTPVEFEHHLTGLADRFGEFYDKFAPTIAANIAVDFFKDCFLTESWEREKWPEVQRRMQSWERGGKTIKNPYKGAALTRPILTGETSDLGRSIEINPAETGNGKATVWTNPSAFARSDKIYAAVHNEGLRAGRGAGFIMHKRQFMGDSPELNRLIIAELERKLNELMKQ